MTPYREPQPDDARIAIAEKELVIDGPPRERRAAFVRMVVVVGAVALVTLIVAKSLAVEVIVLGAAVVYSVWHAARINARGRIVFRIEDDALVVWRPHASEESVPLHTLDDIELETREIRKVGPDANPIAGLSFNQHVAPAVDVARIVLVVKKKPVLRLAEDWISHTEASESFRRLRLFLRARGWIPRGERRTK